VAYLTVLTLSLALFPGFSTALAADEFSSLEEQMTGDEFQRSGLEKLSEAELQFLNQWLKQRKMAPVAGESPRAATSSPASTQEPAASTNPAAQGFRPKAAKGRTAFEGVIDGEFTGWSGKTRFKLTNGQVWEQTDGKTFRHNATNPTVRIEPKSMGTWKLYVEGVNRGVKVTRIK
jgi:hypothetical protein